MDEARKNAFRVLKLPETATQEEIRAAYEKLEERYSEVHYLGSPLWDMAAEKRELIQAAYKELTEEAQSVQTQAPQTEKAEPECSDSVSRRLRALLNRNELDEAQALLEQQENRENDPELLYLRGMLAWKRGWLDEATQFVDAALRLAPQNQEYRTGRERLTGGLPPSARLKQQIKDRQTRRACAACFAECLCEGICEAICDGC
ncbi:MAG: J domain-containing protein [Oscillospiraceae bacterium]|nr:J domain-containing protein [Oscillospiraceae bacterium]